MYSLNDTRDGALNIQNDSFQKIEIYEINLCTIIKLDLGLFFHVMTANVVR